MAPRKKQKYQAPVTDKEIARTIRPVSVSHYMQNQQLSFMIYSCSDRAIPLSTSGVKLGAQRLLWSLFKEGVLPTSRPKKSAKLTSAATGAYHPHGQSAMYDTLTTLAAPFARVRLIDGIGAFGQVPGDNAAADRYTEARLSPEGYSAVKEVTDGAVPMRPTYDNEGEEPQYLPVQYPVLLCAGSQGMGEGWASNIPQHNPREVIAAARALLMKPHLTVDELLEIMPGPDWGTGASVIGQTSEKGIRNYYETGQGTVTLRGKCVVEPGTITIVEVPAGIRVPTLLDGTKKNPGLRDLVRQGIINGVSDVSDLSDLDHGLRIVLTLKRGAKPEEIMDQLHKETVLETTFAASLVALDRNLVPRWWTITELLQDFLTLRDEVVESRSIAQLDKLRLAMDKARAVAAVTMDKDKTVSIIRDSEDKAESIAQLAHHFDLAESQAAYVAELPLYRLSRTDTLDAQKKVESLQSQIDSVEPLTHDPKARKKVIREELDQVAKLFKDPSFDRRTQLEFDTQLSTGTGQDLSNNEKLALWRFDPESFALGEVGERIAEGQEVWAAFHDGRFKRFGGGGLPKRITVKPVVPDLEEVHSAGLYSPEGQDMVFITAGTNKSSTAKILRVNTESMRSQGLSGQGVAGIKLMEGDSLVAALPVTEDDHILAMTDGSWKVIAVADIPIKGTNTQGVGFYKLSKDEAGVAYAVVGGGFTVGGEPVAPVGLAKAPVRKPLDIKDIATG